MYVSKKNSKILLSIILLLALVISFFGIIQPIENSSTKKSPQSDPTTNGIRSSTTNVENHVNQPTSFLNTSNLSSNGNMMGTSNSIKANSTKTAKTPTSSSNGGIFTNNKIQPFSTNSLSAITSVIPQYHLIFNVTNFGWFDAVNNGIPLNITGDDTSGSLNLPFSFPFYDSNFSIVYISSNGYLSFNDTNPIKFSNPTFPDSANYYVISPFWYDLMSSYTNIYAWTTSSYAVIEFPNLTYYPGTSTAGTFEVVLFQNGSILFNYQKINADNGATVGLNYGLDTNYYTSYTGGLANVTDTEIYFSASNSDLSVTLQSPDSMLPGSSTIINATVINLGIVNATNVPINIYLDGVSVASTTISSLVVGSNYTLSYNWNTPLDGTYNFTAYAQPIINETYISNNIKTQFVVIGNPVINPTSGDYLTFIMDDNTSIYVYNFTFTGYIDSINVNTSLIVTVINASTSQVTFVIQGWLVINTITRYIESDSTFGWTGTYFFFWIQTGLSKGVHLNDYKDLNATVTNQTTFTWQQLTYNVYNITFKDGSTTFYGLYDNVTGVLLYMGSPSLGWLNASSLITVNPFVMDLHVPLISDSGSVTYEIGSSGNNITWIATDNNPDNYTIFQNGIAINSSSWVSGTPITINVDGLSIGSYNFTIEMEDFSGHITFDTVTVRVFPYLIKYTMMLNGTNIGWLDAVGNGTNLGISGDDVSGSLKLPFSFPFYDSNFSTVYISSNGYLSFNDTNPIKYLNPSFPDSSDYYVISPFWYDLIASSNIYAWTTSTYAVIEFQNFYYVYNGLAGTFEVVLFPDGSILFNYRSIVSDYGATVGLNYGLDTNYYSAYTNQMSPFGDTELYFLSSKSRPDLSVTLQSPTDILFGSSSIINATVTNFSGTNATNIPFILYIDGTIATSTTIPFLVFGSSYTMAFTWNPTLVGSYNITAYAPPVVNETSIVNNRMNQTVLVSTKAIDPQAGDYLIYVFNSSPDLAIFNITFKNYLDSIRINTSVTVQNIDTSTGLTTSFVQYWIVINTLNRYIETGNLVFWLHSYFANWIQTGLSIGQTLTIWNDTNAIVNNQLIFNLNGNSYSALNISFDIGSSLYDYGIFDVGTGIMLSVTGVDNEWLNESSLVTVNPRYVDLQFPVVSSPGNLIYQVDSTGNKITWTATDNNPDTYTIFKDGFLFRSGSWSSGNPITISVDGLPIGSYNFTITLRDLSAHVVIDTVIVTVTAHYDQYGLLVNSTSYSWFDAITYGNNLNISGDDVAGSLNLPFSFPFYNSQFSTVYISSNGYLSFSNYYPIIYSNPSFPDSVNSYVIAPFWTDLIANNNIYCWNNPFFTVIEFSNFQDVSNNNIGTFEVVLFADGTIYFTFQNVTNLYNSPTVGLNYGLDSNYYSVYNGNITHFSNTLFVFSNSTTEINDGVLSNPKDLSYSTGQTGNKIVWSVNELSSFNYTIYKDGSKVLGPIQADSSVKFNADGLNVGTYNFTIALEYNGSTYSDTVFVNVHTPKSNTSSTTTTTTNTAPSSPTSSSTQQTSSNSSPDSSTSTHHHATPGFDLIIALVGLLGVYYLRRKKSNR